MRVDASNPPESMSETIKHLRAELSQLRKENEQKGRMLVDALKRGDGLRAENERLKGELEFQFKANKMVAETLVDKLSIENQLLRQAKGLIPCFMVEDEYKAAFALKNQALDRCEPPKNFGPGGEAWTCCGGIGEHKPYCWYWTARKAGHE